MGFSTTEHVVSQITPKSCKKAEIREWAKSEQGWAHFWLTNPVLARLQPTNPVFGFLQVLGVIWLKYMFLCFYTVSASLKLTVYKSAKISDIWAIIWKKKEPYGFSVCSSSNVHAESPMGATDMHFLPEASSSPYCMSVDSKGSGETALMCRLAWSFLVPYITSALFSCAGPYIFWSQLLQT